MRLNNKKIRKIVSIKDNAYSKDDIYSEEYREDLIEADSISIAEAGFMQGYEET